MDKYVQINIFFMRYVFIINENNINLECGHNFYIKKKQCHKILGKDQASLIKISHNFTNSNFGEVVALQEVALDFHYS